MITRTNRTSGAFDGLRTDNCWDPISRATIVVEILLSVSLVWIRTDQVSLAINFSAQLSFTPTSIHHLLHLNGQVRQLWLPSNLRKSLLALPSHGAIRSTTLISGVNLTTSCKICSPVSLGSSCRQGRNQFFALLTRVEVDDDILVFLVG